MLKIILSLFILTASAQALDRVVVSIKPIHSLVAAVGQGVFYPQLLCDGITSPHTYTLTHKDIQILQSSTLFIWVGAVYETHLCKVIAKKVTESLPVLAIPGLNLYGPRAQGCPHHDHGTTDGHVWLDPENAKIMIQYFVNFFSKKAPEHAATFEKNGADLLMRLNALKETLQTLMGPIKNETYVVHHDALQYFDRIFGPQLAGTILTDPDLPPTPQSFLTLRNTLKSSPTPPKCLFLEPQFCKDMGEKLAANFGLKTETIDYLGTQVPEGPQAYETILIALATALVQGLS